MADERERFDSADNAMRVVAESRTQDDFDRQWGLGKYQSSAPALSTAPTSPAPAPGTGSLAELAAQGQPQVQAPPQDETSFFGNILKGLNPLTGYDAFLDMLKRAGESAPKPQGVAENIQAGLNPVNALKTFAGFLHQALVTKVPGYDALFAEPAESTAGNVVKAIGSAIVPETGGQVAGMVLAQPLIQKAIPLLVAKYPKLGMTLSEVLAGKKPGAPVTGKPIPSRAQAMETQGFESYTPQELNDIAADVLAIKLGKPIRMPDGSVVKVEIGTPIQGPQVPPGGLPTDTLKSATEIANPPKPIVSRREKAGLPPEEPMGVKKQFIQPGAAVTESEAFNKEFNKVMGKSESVVAALSGEARQADVAALKRLVKKTTDPETKALIEARIAKLEEKPITTSTVTPEKPAAPGAIQFGEKAVKIDFQRLDTEAAITQAKRTLVNTQKAAQGATGKELPRGYKPISIEDAKVLAAWRRTTPEELMAQLRGEDVKIEAMAGDALFARASYEQMKAASVAATDEEFANAWAQFMGIGKATSGKGTDAAQTLRIMREQLVAEPLKVYRATVKTMQKEGLTGDLTKDGEIAALRQLVQTLKPDELIRIANRPNWSDVVVKWGYFSYLSHWKTMAVNLLGSTIVTPSFALSDRSFGALSGMVRRTWGAEDRIRLQEPLALITGYRDGVEKGWLAVADSYKEGGGKGIVQMLSDVVEARASKLDQHIEPYFFHELTGVRNAPAIVKSMAHGIEMGLNTTTLGLKTGDVVMTGLNESMELSALAVRRALRSGKTPGTLEYAQAVRDEMLNPSPETQLAVEKFGQIQVMTDPLGPSAQSILNMLNQHKITKTVFVPFFKFAVNAIHYGVEHAVSPAAGSWRAQWMKGGAERDLANGKLMTAAGLLYLVHSWQAEDDITGDAPIKKEDRDIFMVNHRPNSIRLGGDGSKDEHWYPLPFGRTDPLASVLSFFTNVGTLLREADEGTDSENLPGAVLTSTAQLLSNKSYMQGFGDMTKLLADIRNAPDIPTAHRLADEFFANRAANLVVPGVLNSVTDWTDENMREARTVFEKMAARTPWFSNDLPYKLDFLGNTILKSVQPVKTNPVMEEIDRQDATPQMPPIVMDGVRLNAQEIHDTIHIWAKVATVNGVTLEDGYRALFADQLGNTYSDKTDHRTGGTGKQKMIHDLATEYRAEAKKIFLETHDEFRKKWLEKLGTKQEAVSGERPAESTFGTIPPRAVPPKQRPLTVQ